VTGDRVVLITEYNGARYYGFQLQANLPTIQGEMEKAISKLTGKKSRVMAASRTDAGVHAKGQVASFKTDSPLALRTYITGMNYYLPDDIAVRQAYRVDDSFNVRRNATSREYSYRILNSQSRSPLNDDFSYRVAGHLDTRAMNRACQQLIGKHDFASFATCLEPATKSTTRNVYQAEVKQDDEFVTFTIEANAFLPHQVRNTVGALIEVGLGRMSVDEFYGIIEARKTGLAGPTVPARGLCLTKVNYPSPFEEDLS
jgi:tRNA pseudouridine38-40 synthase